MEYSQYLRKAIREKITSRLSFEEHTRIIQMNTKTRNCKAQYFKQVKNF